jgi:hypothetical protein
MITQLELFPPLPTVRDPMTYWARYRTYVEKSQSWRLIAEETKRLANYQCERCERNPGTTPGLILNAHHRTYLNIFREVPGIDTMCICWECHRYIHAHPQIRADNDNYQKFREAG